MSTNHESAGRQLLRLGEAGAIDMRVSRDVLRECETVIRRKEPSLVAGLALILDQANFAITLDPDQETVERCIELTGYRPDAKILAAAIETGVDMFATLDTQHFLGNPLLGPSETSLRVGTAEQCLEWCRSILTHRHPPED